MLLPLSRVPTTFSVWSDLFAITLGKRSPSPTFSIQIVDISNFRNCDLSVPGHGPLPPGKDIFVNHTGFLNIKHLISSKKQVSSLKPKGTLPRPITSLNGLRAAVGLRLKGFLVMVLRTRGVQGPFVVDQDNLEWHTFCQKLQQNLLHRVHRILGDF